MPEEHGRDKNYSRDARFGMPKEHSEVRVVLETLDFLISEQHAGDLELC